MSSGGLDFEDVSRGNPFNKQGLSDEVRAIIAYLIEAEDATGLELAVTSTTDHPSDAASGNPSRHRMRGTNGEGLALDCRLRTPGNDIHQAVFRLFEPVEEQLHELLYADAPSAKRTDGTVGPYNVKAGRRVRPIAAADHHDHVHVSVKKGTFLKFPRDRRDDVGRPDVHPEQEDDDMTPAQAEQLTSLVGAVARLEVEIRDPNDGISKRLADLTAKVDRLLARQR